MVSAQNRHFPSLIMTCWRHCVDAVASVQLCIKPASGSLRAKPSTCDPAEHAIVGEPNTERKQGWPLSKSMLMAHLAEGMASKSHICRLWSCCRLKQPVRLTPRFSMLVSQAKSDKQPKPFRKMTKWRRRECVHLQTHLIWYRYIYNIYNYVIRFSGL